MKYKQWQSSLYPEQMMKAKRELKETKDSLQQQTTDHPTTQGSLQLDITEKELQKTKGESRTSNVVD